MRITLKDAQTGKEYSVDAAGAAIGRDASRCQISFAEKSVSNVHAKVYAREGHWYLEDQGSSNGTYVAGRRLSGATVLSEGDEFSLFRYIIKVVSLEGVAAKSPADEEEDFRTAATQMLTKDQRDEAVAASKAKGADDEGKAPLLQEEPPDASGGPNHGSVYASTNIEKPPVAVSGKKAEGGSFVATFKRGLAYYPAAVIKLAKSPRATVEATVAKPPLPAMAGAEMAAFAAPAFALGGVATGVATIAATLIGHGAVVSSVISALISIAVNIVVGVVCGFIFHPVLGWLIRILKGSSTPLTRTNYGVASFTATVLTQVLMAVGTIVAVLPVPFINIAVNVLALFGSLVALYTSYVWLRSFSVFKWLQILVLVGMALTTLSSAWGIFNLVRVDIATLGSGGRARVVVGVPSSPSTPVASSAASGSSSSGGGSSFIAKVKGLFKSSKGSATSASADKEVAKSTSVVVSETTASASDGAKSTSGASTPTPASAAKPATTQTAATPAAGPAATIISPHTEPPTSAGGERTSYPEFQRKLDAVEKAIGDDPTLLLRAVGVRPLYKKLHDEISKVQERRPEKGKGKEKAEQGDVYEDRMRQALVYEAAVSVVDDLYVKAVERPTFSASASDTDDKQAKKKSSKTKSPSTKGKSGSR